MARYLNVIGALHGLVFAGLAMSGGLLIAAGVLLFGYAAYDFVGSLLRLVPHGELRHVRYVVDNLVNTLVIAAVIGVPGLILWLGALIEGIASIGILKRWRVGRMAGFATVLPCVCLAAPGWALAVFTVLVLVDRDAALEFAATREPSGA